MHNTNSLAQVQAQAHVQSESRSESQPEQDVPIFVDIEASGFGSHSYPLEVGLALGPDARYCRLIAPDSDWLHWSEEAEALHGLSRSLLLARGLPPKEIAVEMNELLRGKTIFSDCWSVDYPWLRKLFHAAREDMAFRVSSLELLMSERELMQWDSAKSRVLARQGWPRHRASLDAGVVRQTYIEVKNQQAKLSLIDALTDA